MSGRRGKELRLSALGHTWFLDLDGVLFPHNAYRKLGTEGDLPLPGVVEFLSSLPTQDRIVLCTSRPERYRAPTERALRKAKIRWHHLLMGLPRGERVLVNDTKPQGLVTSHAVALERDHGLRGVRLRIDPQL